MGLNSRVETAPQGGERMSVESPSLFAQAIQEHLELKQQNSTLDNQMPLNG